jgi:hypothetical protein
MPELPPSGEPATASARMECEALVLCFRLQPASGHDQQSLQVRRNAAKIGSNVS